MANFGDSILRMMEARRRFRRQMIEMTLDYYKNAFEMSVGMMREAAGEPVDKNRPDRTWRFSWDRPSNSKPENAAPAPTATPPRLLLEGVANEVVVVAFGVENTMPTSCLATFRLAPGSELALFEKQITFLPAQVTLQPGEQTAVQISATITPAMVVDKSYLAEIEVAGLPASGIPIVVRRRDGTMTP